MEMIEQLKTPQQMC